jgi:hypothetical protein
VFFRIGMLVAERIFGNHPYGNMGLCYRFEAGGH